MKLKHIALAFSVLLLAACNDTPIVVEDSADKEENNDSEFDQSGPVTTCEETLSGYEVQELWEMSNAKVHDGRNICFEGYVLSNETFGDLYQGSIAFKAFTDQGEEIPAVFCQFTGSNGKTFMDYEVGDPIKIMGRLVSIDNEDKHNFMFAECSLPLREVY